MALCVLVNIRFQVLFHSPPGVLFTFPSQYCSTIGHQVVFRLGGWSPRVLCGFHVPTDTLDTDHCFAVSSTGLSPSSVYPSRYVRLQLHMLISVLTPLVFLPKVWPLPISLATTFGISFDFFSSPYLDVSVREVPFLTLFYSGKDLWLFAIGVSPFGDPRVKAYFQLTVAYRRLSRPSSALGAKAFTLCSFSLEQLFLLLFSSRFASFA